MCMRQKAPHNCKIVSGNPLQIHTRILYASFHMSLRVFSGKQMFWSLRGKFISILNEFRLYIFFLLWFSFIFNQLLPDQTAIGDKSRFWWKGKLIKLNLNIGRVLIITIIIMGTSAEKLNIWIRDKDNRHGDDDNLYSGACPLIRRFWWAWNLLLILLWNILLVCIFNFQYYILV